MAEFDYDSAGIVKYDASGHTWLEVKNPTHITQTGQGFLKYDIASFFMLPGSQTDAVSCYVDMYVCIRVNENLDAQIKIVPGNEIAAGCSGIYYGYVYPGSCRINSDYMGLMVVYKNYFEITTSLGNNHLYLSSSDGLNPGILQYANSDASNGFAIFHKVQSNYADDYGTCSYSSNGRRFHWNIGYGGNAGTQGYANRWDDNWKNSPGWISVGNLESNFHWGDASDQNAYMWMCGCGYYLDDWATTIPVSCRPKQITFPGLKRLLNYFPWSVYKSGVWKSCDRTNGHVKRMSHASWVDRKNRLD